LIGAFDDLDRHTLAREIGFEFAARITAVGKDMDDEGEGSPCRADQRCGAIAILHAGGKNLDAE